MCFHWLLDYHPEWVWSWCRQRSLPRCPPVPPQSAAEYKREYGTSSKETRRYKFDRLSDLALVPLDPGLDAVETMAERVDRQEFVSLLSGLLRLGPSSRLTPEQALQRPFITQHHLAVHTSVPM